MLIHLTHVLARWMGHTAHNRMKSSGPKPLGGLQQEVSRSVTHVNFKRMFDKISLWWLCLFWKMIPLLKKLAGSQCPSVGRALEAGASEQGGRQAAQLEVGRPAVRACSSSQSRSRMWEERRAVRRGDWWETSEQMRGGRMLPRVGSLHYLCGHCGHAGHSLLVRDLGLKPRSEHNLLQPLGTSHNLLQPREKLARPKSVHSFEQINTGAAPPGRRKKRRRR